MLMAALMMVVYEKKLAKFDGGEVCVLAMHACTAACLLWSFGGEVCVLAMHAYTAACLLWSFGGEVGVY